METENKAPAEWIQALPEQLRDAPFLGKASSPEDAVAKLAHAAKLVGTSIRIPGEDATDDDRAAFYNKLAEVPGVAKLPLSDDEDGLAAILAKLGAPDTPDGYKPPELEGFEWDQATFENLRKYAKDAGMTTRQFDKFARQLAQEQLAQQQQAQQQQARPAPRRPARPAQQQQAQRLKRHRQHQSPLQREQSRLPELVSQSELQRSAMEPQCLLCRSRLQIRVHRQQQCRQLF